MIVVDASALVAILLNEPEAYDFVSVLSRSATCMSPIGYWEAAVKLDSYRGRPGVADLDALIANFDIEVVSATQLTATEAFEAQVLFGKRTPAKLNLGDCFAYALARTLDAPLLFKGDDFSRTDIKTSLTPL